MRIAPYTRSGPPPLVHCPPTARARVTTHLSQPSHPITPAASHHHCLLPPYQSNPIQFNPVQNPGAAPYLSLCMHVEPGHTQAQAQTLLLVRCCAAQGPALSRGLRMHVRAELS
ncbi:hypothetical protein BDV95DRAFT_562774 [Massariosphaeria phaeospora]|uniref:Uncharacterized protein n=1 Tax=Massariosphaeria phaeospora TaxID=100035 RepID=A0A7C8MDL9_9PLEO|nr:hypothetical protein BDV95DRAFT_562774 [Massariosphaeria phaeospora]